MDYIKSYFLSVITVILFTVLVEILMPSTSFKKYIKLVLGLLVILTIAGPVVKLTNFNVSSFATQLELAPPDDNIEYVQENQINRVFCENIEAAVKEDILNKFNESADVTADADTNELRKITIVGVSEGNRGKVRQYVLDTYGAKEVVAGGE